MSVGKERWAEEPMGRLVARYVKTELKRQAITYQALADLLTQMGYEETQASIASKLSRGSFSAGFFFAVMLAIRKRVVTVDEVVMALEGEF